MSFNRQVWWLPRSLSIRVASLSNATIVTLPQVAFSVFLIHRFAVRERARAQIELVAAAKGAARSFDEKFAAAEAELRILATSTLLTSNDLEASEQLLRHVSARARSIQRCADLCRKKATVLQTEVAIYHSIWNRAGNAAFSKIGYWSSYEQ